MTDGAFADDVIAGEETAMVDFAVARVAGYGTTGSFVVACFAASTGVRLAVSRERLRGRDLRDLGDECAIATDVE